MADPLEIAVQSILRDSEQLKIAIHTRATPGPSEQEDTNLNTRKYSSSEGSGEKKRVLAIVTHIDISSGDEQGCVFILRPKTNSATVAPDNYVVEHVFPVLEKFSVTVAQARRNTANASSSTVKNKSSTDLTLTIHPGHDPALSPVYVSTYDIPGLRSLLGECKRLTNISVANNEAGIIPPYPWMLHYISASPASVLSAVPSDLRHAHKPVHSLLSQAYAGSPGDDVLDISIIREHWMRSKVLELYASSDHSLSLKLRIGTFNVNGKLPSQDLSSWVRRRPARPKLIPSLNELSPLSLGETARDPMDDINVSEINLGDDAAETMASAVPLTSTAPSSVTTLIRGDDGNDDPDILVLAFQELDLSAGALLYSSEKTREDAWFTAAMAGLGEKAELYEKLASKQLVGMLLIIVVKTSIKGYFTNVQATSVGAGIMGLMGNKGATALRLTICPPTSQRVLSPLPIVLTFVNSHLAAFDEMYEKRNIDFHDLSKRLSFDSGIPFHDDTIRTDDSLPLTVSLNVYQSDILFWMGDLNYRINLKDSDVRSLLSSSRQDNVALLLKFDQLKRAMNTQQAFTYFEEYPITHMPSYRFSPGVLADSLGYDMKRKPAWTDRILNMCSTALRMRQTAYMSHPEITMSDHRPVSAEFELSMPSIDSDELEAFVHKLWEDVAGFEDSEDTPRLKLETSLIDFGKIGYKKQTSKSVSIRNIGQVPCTFRFVPIAPGASVQPIWLKIEPLTGLLRPDEVTEISVQTVVGDRVASQLNLQETDLEATLILHTALGKDHFLTVIASYERTCFATSLERLARMPGPVRTLTSLDLLPENQASSAPKEIMRLVNWLMSNATEVGDLFLTTGDSEAVAGIREALDTGAELPILSTDNKEKTCRSVASCLRGLLDSLPDPVVPTTLHQECFQVSSREEAFELLTRFPSASVNVWISMTALLSFISQQGNSSSNSEKAESLAAVFAPVLLRDDSKNTLASPVEKRRFLLFFFA